MSTRRQKAGDDLLREIAQAIADVISKLPDVPLNAVSYRHVHEWDASTVRSVKVAVAPRGADFQNASRGAASADYRVGIVVARSANTDEDAQEVFRIAEAVLDAVRETVVLDLPGSTGKVAFVSASFECGADETLNEQNIYRGTIEATYKLLKGP